MVVKADRARQDARLVPDPPVRERGQPRHPFPHHGARDHRRLQGREARLLGDRLRHRRHAEGRVAGARQGNARHQDRALRARGRAADRQRRRSRSAIPTDRRPRRIPAFKPHPMQGWTPDFIPKLTEDAVDMKVIDRIIHVPGADGIKWSGELATQGRHLRRHHRGRDVRRRAEGRRRRAEGREHPRHAARHRRALSEHAAVRQRAGRHDRGGAGDLALDAGPAVQDLSRSEPTLLRRDVMNTKAEITGTHQALVARC